MTRASPSNPSASAKAPEPVNPFRAALKEDRVMVAVGAGGVG
jgi:hypothetical protein